MIDTISWTSLRHQILRDIKADSDAVWHDGDRWRFQHRRSTITAMSTTVDDLWRAGLIDVYTGERDEVELSRLGTATLADWDGAHPEVVGEP